MSDKPDNPPEDKPVPTPTGGLLVGAMLGALVGSVALSFYKDPPRDDRGRFQRRRGLRLVIRK